MPEAGEEFALRTPDGEYLAWSEAAGWTQVTEAATARRYRDSREALADLETLRSAGHVVDLYTTDGRGEFAVAVA